MTEITNLIQELKEIHQLRNVAYDKEYTTDTKLALYDLEADLSKRLDRLSTAVLIKQAGFNATILNVTAAISAFDELGYNYPTEALLGLKESILDTFTTWDTSKDMKAKYLDAIRNYLSHKGYDGASLIQL